MRAITVLDFVLALLCLLVVSRCWSNIERRCAPLGSETEWPCILYDHVVPGAVAEKQRQAELIALVLRAVVGHWNQQMKESMEAYARGMAIINEASMKCPLDEQTNPRPKGNATCAESYAKGREFGRLVSFSLPASTDRRTAESPTTSLTFSS